MLRWWKPRPLPRKHTANHIRRTSQQLSNSCERFARNISRVQASIPPQPAIGVAAFRNFSAEACGLWNRWQMWWNALLNYVPSPWFLVLRLSNYIRTSYAIHPCFYAICDGKQSTTNGSNNPTTSGAYLFHPMLWRAVKRVATLTIGNGNRVWLLDSIIIALLG